MFQVMIMNRDGIFAHYKRPTFAAAQEFIMRELNHSGIGWSRSEDMGVQKDSENFIRLGSTFFGVDKMDNEVIVARKGLRAKRVVGMIMRIEIEDFGVCSL